MREHIINWFFTDKKKLYKLKNIYKGKRCFIIGNGPSLSASDLDYLYNEISFASNKIFNIYPSTRWRPTFYIVSDGAFVKEYGEISQDKSQSKINFYPTIDAWKMKKKPNSMLFKMRPYNGRNVEFSTNITKYLCEGCTVTYAMIQIAIYMGFSEIYLLGVDCNNFGTHFYQEKQNKKLIVAEDTINISMESFDKAKEVSENLGIKIVNATRGGKLDIFPRLPLEDILTSTMS